MIAAVTPGAATRVLCLLIVAIGLMLVSLADLLVFFAGMLVLFTIDGGPARVRGWLRAVWQLKYLFAALLVLYLGFTAGQPLIADWPRPSVAGAVEGAHRTLILVALLLAVHWLVRPVAPTELAGGLAWLAQPLAQLGVPVTTASRRVALTLHAVDDLQATVSAARAQRDTPWLDRLAGLVRSVERDAAAESSASTVDVVPLGPRPAEWVWPLAMAAVLTLLAGL